MPPPPVPVTIAATFSGAAPSAAAVQTGSGAFTPLTVQGAQASFTLPAGTTRYALAYVCTFLAGTQTVTDEFVIEATVQDSTSLTPACVGAGAPTTGSATGTVDVSAISGATKTFIVGTRGIGSELNLVSGSFNVNLLPGMNDVAVIAVDASFNTLAVRILPAQNVPGAINGGNAIVLGSGDLTLNQPFIVNNIPSGFSTPTPFVSYRTVGGTTFRLQTSAAGSYAAVPAASAQSGDIYRFEATSSDTATHSSEVAVEQSAAGGGPVTLTLPLAWMTSAPAPAALPTLTFNYSGFSGNPGNLDRAEINWSNSTLTTSTAISVTATSSFQNGATTITIPDLSALPGFPAHAASGANILWFANIEGTTTVSPFGSGAPANVSIPLVANFGAYTVP